MDRRARRPVGLAMTIRFVIARSGSSLPQQDAVIHVTPVHNLRTP